MFGLYHNYKKTSKMATGTEGDTIWQTLQNIKNGVESVCSHLEDIGRLHRSILTNPAPQKQEKQLKSLNLTIADLIELLTWDLKEIVRRDDYSHSEHSKQVGFLTRSLHNATRDYLKSTRKFEKDCQSEAKRLDLVIHGERSQEVFGEEIPQQVFLKAILQSDRQGQSQQVVGRVADRHAKIQGILDCLVDIKQAQDVLTGDVERQELAIRELEQNSQKAEIKLKDTTTALSRGVVARRARNKRKKWCIVIGSKFSLD